jgi:phenylacetate-coenzyme A ligase PaaK-like adenylate-forming protein
VFATVIAQLRTAASIGFGKPFAPWALNHLIDAIIATKREFGAADVEDAGFLGGPVMNEETQREVQARHFRNQAVRGAQETAYYEHLFTRLGLDPARLSFEDIAHVPPTPKAALREAPGAFVRRTATPSFRATTTGTTGKPTSVYFSAHEMQTYIALAANSFLFSGNIDASDIVQISTSSRAALGNTCFAGACIRIGALAHLAGLVDPVHTLRLLSEEHRIPGKKPKISYLATYSSYLGELVECGLQQGYRPQDFGLECISISTEIASEGLKARARRLFGPVQFDETYSMTETWPFSGQTCSEGHLHFESVPGLLEVISPETGAPASAGEVGTIVATPLPPYRDTTILLRYDTQDVVRPVAGPFTCNLRNLQATTRLLGKLSLSIRHEHGWTFPRDVLEALEGSDDVPLPARYGFWEVPEGVAVEVVTREVGPKVRRAIEARLEEQGVPVRQLRLVGHRSELRRPVPLRCDLREMSFSTPSDTNPDLELALNGLTVRGN